MAESGDDDYTQIFGVGTELGGPPLLLGFTAVALYLLTFSSLLDKLEGLTLGTSYHLVLQRIYREIMMVGFGSFAFTILNQTNTSLPFGLNTAFGFADICCFAMSSFFCLQGVFIMLLSVKQAQNWNVASQIPAEELLHNMSVWELSHPLAWRSRFLPFCPTREQVEFRVLKSIFATAYNIKASHNEFDFAIFLRMSHENNIVKLIDITFKNWFYILFLIVAYATTDVFHDTSCSTDTCVIHEDLYVFTVIGCIICLLSIIAWLWGRSLELRLISSAGVERSDDYAIFLMTEFRTEEKLSGVATSATSAKDIIANYLKEKEINEVETKETQYLRRQSMFKSVNGDFSTSFRGEVGTSLRKSQRKLNEINEKLRLANANRAAANARGPGGSLSPTSSNSSSCNDSSRLLSKGRSERESGRAGAGEPLQDDERCDLLSTKPTPWERGGTHKSSVKVSPVCYEDEGGEEKTEVQAFTYPDETDHSKNITPITAGRVVTHVCSTDLSTRSNEMSTRSNEASVRSIASDDELVTFRVEPRRKVVVEAAHVESRSGGSSLIVKRKNNTQKRVMRLRSSGEQARNLIKSTFKSVLKTKRQLSRQASEGWRASVESMLAHSSSKDSQLSAKEREARFENIVKSNFGKQNFKELFLFKRPSLFYGLISFVITCNSLYLAFWATNHIFLIFQLDGYMHRLWYILVTLAPPIITFPTIFLAIRSSTIMKAITLLDLTVVAKVIEQSQINTTMLADFRKTIVNFMKKDGPGIDGMIKCCNRFARGNTSALKKSDFREMLLHNKVIYTPEKIDFLFGSIDLNGGSTVDYAELESFLFSDNNYESDQKRQELFHKMSIHKMKGMRKQVTKKGDNPAQRILKGLNFETFKEKKFVAAE